MVGWRLSVAAVLLLVIGLPLALPFVEWWRVGGGEVWAERERIVLLAGNTLRLVAGTLALALPAGVAGAILLYRTDVPLAGLWRFVMLTALFVPLPVFASAWQATLGSGGWLPSASWSTPPPGDPDLPVSGPAWKPWAQGLGAACWVQALASLPWVILIVGQGLRWVEVELEEDALTWMHPARVLRHVTLPRAGGTILAAGVWVALQTSGDITITDMLQVRTFAEEVYYQFVVGDRAALARSVVLHVPAMLGVGALVIALTVRLERRLPPLNRYTGVPLLFRLGPARWPAFGLIVLLMALWAGVPLLSLVWKAGLSGSPEVFSARVALGQVAQVFQGKWPMIGASLLLAGAAGAVTARLAFVGCALATASRGFLTLLLVLLAAAWTLPAPVIGLGLKDVIDACLAGEEWLAPRIGLPSAHPARSLLYDGPSLLPLLWVAVIRFFPCALAILWPVVRLLPSELRDAARVDGASPRQEIGLVVWPLFFPTVLQAGLAVAILSLGEISAGKFVETPGATTFAHELFNQMHYGVQAKQSALCLVLLLPATAGAGLLALGSRLFSVSDAS